MLKKVPFRIPLNISDFGIDTLQGTPPASSTKIAFGYLTEETCFTLPKTYLGNPIDFLLVNVDETLSETLQISN